jgi:hypothetical protein
MLELLAVALLLLHGVMHMIGFVQSFGLRNYQKITVEISRFFGLIWLSAATLFVAAATALQLGISWWHASALAAAALSQVAVIAAWRDAKYATVLNVLIAIMALWCW